MFHGKFGMENKLQTLKRFYKNKKVFLTGHTGFKGSWLCVFLNLLGAKVVGYSLKPEKKLNLFDLADVSQLVDDSIIADIRDYNSLKKAISNFSPDFVVHMAAQPLVRDSYVNPKYSYEVNTLGTINILNILNELNFIKSALIVTTDKVYFNNNDKNLYKENDLLGGLDPYSSSKSCAELAVNSYNHSFFFVKKILIATARAGNVIGGGDFSKDRILPDYFRSLATNKKLILRSPNSIRPWQHIIDPLYGYILLLMTLHKKQKFIESSWNFGPNKSNNQSVSNVVNLINEEFHNSVKIVKKNNRTNKYYESKVLMLNSDKSKKYLNWEAQYGLKESIKLTSIWHKKFLAKANMLNVTQKQIIDYIDRL
jgi:CDP-glucose 4,6-dehydratase